MKELQEYEGGLPVTHRQATANDATRLAELLWDHVEEYTPLDPSDRAAYVSACSEHIRGRLGVDLHCWITEDDGFIVAHIYIIVTRKLPKPGKPCAVWGRLSTVRTLPGRRNQGIGGALLERVTAWGREQGLEELVVWPSERSVPFYERAGFKGENDVMEMLFE